MIITNDANIAALASRINEDATEADARTALDNLIEAGWGGWDSIDLPEGLIQDAAKGPIEGPEVE